LFGTGLVELVFFVNFALFMYSASSVCICVCKSTIYVVMNRRLSMPLSMYPYSIRMVLSLSEADLLNALFVWNITSLVHKGLL
jgi:hypothetical protein